MALINKTIHSVYCEDQSSAYNVRITLLGLPIFFSTRVDEYKPKEEKVGYVDSPKVRRPRNPKQVKAEQSTVE
jgi:hypothetical protein